MTSVALTLIMLAVMLPVSAVRPVARSAPFPPSSRVEQSDPLAVWNTESERNLRQVLRLARAAHEEALTKVAIGTLAPIHVAVLETTVAQLEEAAKNFTPSTTPLTPQGLKSRRAVFEGALRSLESTERRFTNGSATTTQLAGALMNAALVVQPSIQAPGPTSVSLADHTSPFTFRPDATPADASRAREFTGHVSFIDGTRAAPRGFVYITGEVKNPGKYPLVGSMTVLKLLALAGDVLPSADKNRIVIVSGTATDQDGKPLTRFINYNDLMNGKNLSENNLDLGPGDAVIVHPPGR
jgi:hypothetical protein